MQPAARTGAHHHGELETVLYIIRGRARFRWGDRLEFVEEAGPGDFIYVPPFVPHQEMNARPDEPVEAVVVRSGQEPIVVNLDIESPEPAEPALGRVRFIRSRAKLWLVERDAGLGSELPIVAELDLIARADAGADAGSLGPRIRPEAGTVPMCPGG